MTYSISKQQMVLAFIVLLPVTPNVTISAIATIGAGGVGTAQLQAGAVTSTILANGAVGNAQINADLVQYVKVPMTAAQWLGMYAAPFILIAAPGAGLLTVVHKCVIETTFVSAANAAGGVWGLQYANTVHGAGTAASGTQTAATAFWAASSTTFMPGATESAASATTVNEGVYISNLTQAFTTGDSTYNVHLWYSTVTA